MQLPNPKDAVHRGWLYRVLIAFYDDPYLASVLRFKGGTAAAMMEILDRFSIDLDFDLVGQESDIKKMRKQMEKIFGQMKLEIKDQSQRWIQYFLKYPAQSGERNTLKIDVSFPPSPANRYEARRILQIDRIVTCQAPETMFANKLVALIGRYKQKKIIAGRDVYDVHHFFENGLRYEKEVVEERTGQGLEIFFEELIDFMKKKVTDKDVDEDLNMLLSYDKFRIIRKTLKQETIIFLQEELNRIKHLV